MAKAFVCARGDNWQARLAKWWLWYGMHPNCIPRTKSYMLQRMLAETPVPDCEREAITKLYRHADRDGLEVDHIIPLSRGGLHVLANLQALTKAEHRRKTNGEPESLPLLRERERGQLEIFK